MSKGTVNKVILIGNLGKDPEVRITSSNNALLVANISLATTESWKNKTSGESQEKTEWHRITLYNKLAEITEKYLRKGSKVFIEGRLQTRKWQDKTGQDRYTTEIIADSLEMLGKGTGIDSEANLPLDSLAKDNNIPVIPTAPSSEEFDEDVQF